jgi:hypothetical protein
LTSEVSDHYGDLTCPHHLHSRSTARRSDAEEFYRVLQGVVIDDTGVFNDKLRGRTTTTTIAPTAPSAAKPPTNAQAKNPNPGVTKLRQMQSLRGACSEL